MELGGEYGGISRGRARALFLLCIENIAVEVIEDLQELLPLYGELNWDSYISNVQNDPIYKLNPKRDVDMYWNALVETPERKNLKQAIIQWAEKYNIVETWFYEAGLRVINIAHNITKYFPNENDIKTEPELLTRYQFKTWGFDIDRMNYDPSDHWNYSELWLTNLEQPKNHKFPDCKFEIDSEQCIKFKLLLETPPWNPFEISRANYRKVVIAEYIKNLDEYLDFIESNIPGAVQKTQHARNMERFEWLVRYQVKRESYNDIAKTLLTDEEQKLSKDVMKDIIESRKVSVRNRVKETANYCGITLRPHGKAGRPKKK